MSYADDIIEGRCCERCLMPFAEHHGYPVACNKCAPFMTPKGKAPKCKKPIKKVQCEFCLRLVSPVGMTAHILAKHPLAEHTQRTILTHFQGKNDGEVQTQVDNPKD